MKKIVLSAVLIFTAFWIMPAAAKRAPKALTNDSPKAAVAVAASQQKPAPMPQSDLPNPPDAVLVKVNGQPITAADLNKEIGQIKEMMQSRGASPQQFESLLKSVKPQILEGLIVRRLVADECERQKIKVTPEDTAREIEAFKASLSKKISLDDFLKQNGITKENFERDANEQIKIEKLLKISPATDAEIKAFYDTNKAAYYEAPETINARHILIKFDAADDAIKKEAKKKKAEALRQQLLKGADFAKLAEENSDCPSKLKGGKLDDFSRGRMVPAFEEAAFALKTNEISGVVETEFGYHVIQTLGHNPPRTVPLDEVKGQIAFRLKSRQIQEKLEVLIGKLKESAKIEYQKAGEALKVSPPDDNNMPVFPVEKSPEKEKSAQDKTAPSDSKK